LTVREVERAAQDDARISFIAFTRNFGKEAAIHAGLEQARGDVAIVLDSDLQHPPSLIPQMLDMWRGGAFVVEAVKSHRGVESLSGKLFAKTFYFLFRHLAGLDLAGHSDFKLLDRKVIDTYLAFPERHRFFRGLIEWAKFPSAQIPFSVPERAGGTSQWNKLKLIRYAVNNLTHFSSLPLRLVTYIGLSTLCIGTLVGIVSLVQKFRGAAVDGFTTVNLLVVLMGGAILLGLGIVGHYLALIYDEIKGRPSYLVKPWKKDASDE
jgi:dolichol-phosphate mannosyltransferase